MLKLSDFRHNRRVAHLHERKEAFNDRPDWDSGGYRLVAPRYPRLHSKRMGDGSYGFARVWYGPRQSEDFRWSSPSFEHPLGAQSYQGDDVTIVTL